MRKLDVARRLLLASLLIATTAGCAVVSVATTATSLAVGVVSTAVDVAIGAGKVTAKVIGAGIDVVTPGPSAPPAVPKP